MKVSDKHLAALVRHFQAGDSTLKVDGIYGLHTYNAVREYIKENASPGPLANRMDLAWEVALLDVGNGGVGGNNKGTYIEGLRAYCKFPVDATGPWCAIFQSKHLLGSGIPIRSRGAYRLCEKMANHPKGFEVPVSGMEIGRGYLACWKRGRWITHQEAHVRMVRSTGNLLEYIGGNEWGDKVRTGHMTFGDFEKDLIMVVGWNG